MIKVHIIADKRRKEFYIRHIFTSTKRNTDDMRTDTTTYQGAFSSILLPGTILLANIDMTGLFDYALKALAGGAIWLGYKVVADHL